ncbi:YdiU family protein [Clostridium swellfunianum]|uniref:protein adenylyltransferase SelO n=1 Tax=Clostridium swellfunianum TaxID=1367462 RepID=UPI0020308B77|nr:YdiU family protein [Clostridium swellfunianum]MCM0648548.1 YdiU family protein [Clostridium swellfunianum]
MADIKEINQIGWYLDNSYANLPETFFSKVKPTPVSSPRLVVLNEPLAEALGFSSKELKKEESTAVFGGNKLPEGTVPIAQAYAGHQFGHFTMLGDGRVILLGEQIAPSGERFDIQLKGSGRTPYSRGGDGRAALGPMLREYIISEAMQGLGIPTTRSLAVVTTGEEVMRETPLIGAILTRVAKSHIRVATFQYAAAGGTVHELKALADYTIKRHYKELEGCENLYLSFLKAVVERQASLIAKWMLVGFIHGVMNTDNMTISGETIDYGPCAFMDIYDPAAVFSSIDRQGRYAYSNQPTMGAWNLARFAETLLPLLHDDENEAVRLAQEAVSEFSQLYHNSWLSGMREKLGIFNEELQDKALVEDLLNMMYKYKADYTNTFLALSYDKPEDVSMWNTDEFNYWLVSWKDRLSRQAQAKDVCWELMRKSNPSVIPRNHRVEEAISAAENGDFSVMHKLLKVLTCPFSYSTEHAEYASLPPKTNKRYRTFCGT